MANPNNPHGLRPLGISLSGGPSYIETFLQDSTWGTALFAYDAVNRVAGGVIQASATPGTTKYSGVSLDYGAASTATAHLVVSDPGALYEAQGDGSGALNVADMGLNANLVLTAGNATTKVSKHQIAESTKATTATLDVKLMQHLNDGINAAGANARVEIVFNAHRNNGGIAGV